MSCLVKYVHVSLNQAQN